MSTRTLRPDDISTGDLITVRLIRKRVTPDQHMVFSFTDDDLLDWEDDWQSPDFFYTWDHNAVGQPLVVTAINLPFIAVLRADSALPATVDIRAVLLQRITENYARAAIGSDAMEDLMRRSARTLGVQP